MRLPQEPKKHFPLRQLIFRYSNNDILEWLPANHGQDALDLLVVQSRGKNRENRAQTPTPAKGRYRFLNRNVWEDAVGIMQVDENGNENENKNENKNENENEEEEEWLEAESEGEAQPPPHRAAILLDEVSINT